MPSTSHKKAWLLCASGAHNALDRIDAAIATNEPDAKIIQPLIEALWWVCAADETLMREYPSEWGKHIRPELHWLPVLKGLRWIRNRVTHQIPQWDIAKAPFVWHNAHDIAPIGSVGPGHDHGRTEYEKYLQGHDARIAIQDVKEGIIREATAKLPP